MKTKMNIESLVPYEVMTYKNVIRLDANESAYNMDVNIFKSLNRYPDDRASELKNKLADYLKVFPSELVIGNGSSEMIELLFRTFIEKGDKVLGFENSFSMYKVFSTIYEADYITVSNDYVMDMDELIRTAIYEQPKMIMICNPNNPTGYLISKCDIERLLKMYDGLVVVDEAYIEFSEGSMLNRLDTYDNLVILRTFSKAWGLAGARVGYMIASENIVSSVLKVKAPYNLNALSQQAALYALDNKETMAENVRAIILEREIMERTLDQLDIKAYKSSANFIYFKGQDDLYEALLKKGVLVRFFGAGRFRVTIGKKEENESFVKALKEALVEIN
ncbi:histidinol-phosphate transaminase [Acidaminobacter sp. JC074]|uniref:histidinol-phosphate transaminase n=1 Tax=Acidaminobacter sp. JC074 TaxID=2530199 RepID=UPI001F0FDCDD|nr:histidinol-phosphate transaminase [Acidaminobacter sp. JC074]